MVSTGGIVFFRGSTWPTKTRCGLQTSVRPDDGNDDCEQAAF
jgi:hypothetical protein